MKKVAFIGGYFDKSDILLYLSKIIYETGKKVLLIDATAVQKTKFIVPTIAPGKTYITTFLGVDVAVGFDSMNTLRTYLKVAPGGELPYDYVLVDLDTAIAYRTFEIKKDDLTYFLTSFDAYSLKRGVKVLSAFAEPTTVQKLLFSKTMTKEEDDYLNFLAMKTKVVWEKEVIAFPLENGDQNAIFINQRLSRIKLKDFSKTFVDNLMYVAERILDCGPNEVRKAVKKF